MASALVNQVQENCFKCFRALQNVLKQEGLVYTSLKLRRRKSEVESVCLPRRKDLRSFMLYFRLLHLKSQKGYDARHLSSGIFLRPFLLSYLGADQAFFVL